MAGQKIILCDTNIIIEFLKNNKDIVDDLTRIGESSVYISTITAAELYFGALNKTELDNIKTKIGKLIHIPLNQDISDIFEKLMLKHSLAHKLSIPDALIAATALYYDLELYTLNIKDFKFIKDIRLYK